MDVRVGLWRRLSAKELMLQLWCWKKTRESPLDFKEIQPVHSKGDQPWVFFRRTNAKAETPIIWPPHAKSWLIGKDSCWEALAAGGKGDDRGWDGWMASLTGWTWVWVNSGSWWWTGRASVLRFMGSQRVGHDWVTELNWDESETIKAFLLFLDHTKHTPASELLYLLFFLSSMISFFVKMQGLCSIVTFLERPFLILLSHWFFLPSFLSLFFFLTFNTF